MNNLLSVRELSSNDVPFIMKYWYESDKDYLVSLGADLAKIPSKEVMEEMLLQAAQLPIEKKQSYCIIWEINGQPSGHSNINKIIFGQEAYMHLHLWNTGTRQKGMGASLVKMTLPYFFNNCKLKMLYCEPYALNAAPNKTLAKAGFTFVKEYVTVPGYINFEQPVKRWELSHADFQKIV